MTEQRGSGTLTAFTSRAERYRLYAVLAASVEAGDGLTDTLANLSRAYREGSRNEKLAAIIGKVSEAIRSGMALGAALAALPGASVEEAAILRLADAKDPAAAARAIDRAAALVAWEDGAAGRTGAAR